MDNEATKDSYKYETPGTLGTIITAIQESATASTQRCGLVTLTLQFSSEEELGARNVSKISHHHLLARSTRHYLQTLRPLVRKTDRVFLLNSTFYFVLLGANIEGAKIVEARLWDALLWCVHNAQEAKALPPHLMTIGHAAYPERNASACVVAASKPSCSFDTQPEIEAHSSDILQDKYEVALNTEAIALEDELTALAHKLGMPYLSLLPRKKPEQVQRLVTLKLAHELQCYPLGRERGTLTVALSNPQDTSILSRLQQETGLRIFPVLTHPQELQTVLNLLI